jgi:broad specificity phosphatase PhoE
MAADKIIIIRHGQTAWNKDKIFRGRIDVELNEIGKKQAKACADALKDTQIVAFYTSPLLRAMETAQIIASPHKKNVTAIKELIDFNFGKWQGLQEEKVKLLYPKEYKIWKTTPHLASIPEGETLQQAMDRSMKCLKKLIDSNNGTIVVVSHRVIIKLLLCGILGIGPNSFWKIKQDTGAYSVVDHKDGNFTLSILNESCHLKEAKEDNTKVEDF